MKYYQDIHNAESDTARKARAKAREINNHLESGKAVYWDQSPEKRYRLMRAKTTDGKLKVKVLAAGNVWKAAAVTDHFEFYR